VFITKATAPLYLQNSLFLQEWDDSPEAVAIPSSVLKLNEYIANNYELLHLLTSLRFWIVNELPTSLFKFCLTTKSTASTQILQQFSQEWQLVRDLLRVKQLSDSWTCALQIESIPCIEVLHRTGKSHDISRSCSVVAGAGFLASLQCLYSSGFQCDADTMCSSARHGTYDCMKFLHEIGCPWDESCIYESASTGHVECLHFALEKGCTWSNQAAYIAAAKGHVSCVREFVLRNANTEFLAKLSHVAAAHGQLSVLQYMRPFDCQWDHLAVIYSSKAGSVECLEYLHSENLFFYGETVNIVAACHGHLDCLKYAVERGCFISMDTYHHADVKREDILVYLKELGFWDDRDDLEAMRNEEVVEYVFETGSDAYWGLDIDKPTPLKV